MSASALALFFGQGAGNGLFRAFDGKTDDGLPFQALAVSAPMAPGGSSGEAVFTGIFFSLTWSNLVGIRLIPVLDGVALDGVEGQDCIVGVGVPAPTDGEPKTETFYLPLSYGVFDPVDPTHEVARVHLRGQRLALRVEDIGDYGDGIDFILEDVEVEFEPVRQRRRQEAM